MAFPDPRQGASGATNRLICVLCALDELIRPDGDRLGWVMTIVNGHATCADHLGELADVNHQRHILDALRRVAEHMPEQDRRR